ncbi:MAG: hypothetical protein AAGG48_27340 [Planctomycetota bacterium]
MKFRNHRHRFFSSFCCLMLFAFTIGCTQQDNTPVQTTADEIDQYLADNPDENYSSDGIVADATTGEEQNADGSGDGEGESE